MPESASSRRILIRSGRILDPGTRKDLAGDLLVEDGMISAIAQPGEIKAPDARALDAKGCWVVPGLIDVHVHLREPGLEYKETIETGTRAAVAGGFTSVACMANTQPVNDSALVTAFIREKAKIHGSCRVFPVGAVTKGLKGEELAEIGSMVAEGAVAVSDDGMPVMNSLLMRRAMEYAKSFGIPLISHAEDLALTRGGIINESARSVRMGLSGNPAAAEEIIVAREIALCRLTGCRVHVAHLSTRLAVEMVRRAKDEGLPVTAEVTPHHVCLTDGAVGAYDTCCKMAPPLRSEEDREAVQKALADGTIDMIATDHAPHGILEKDVEFDRAPNGITGVETAVPTTLELVHSGALSLERWLESLTLAPARLLNLPYGSLEIGKAADITVIDPHLGWTYSKDTVLSKSANSPYIGKPLKGRAVHTLVGGVLRHSLR